MSSVQLVEVGPRDGLQNESVLFSTEEKIFLIESLALAGVDRIEVASFAHPKRVPQMADAEAVISGLSEFSRDRGIALVLNERGMERAIASGIPEVHFVVVASDTFAQKNQGMSTQGLIDTWHRIASMARHAGIRASVGVSAAFGCPFEGEVPISRVIEIIEDVIQSSPVELGIADTIGSGVPRQVETLFRLAKDRIGDIPLRGHFHNTRNSGIANAYVAANEGCDVLDSSIGGIGGCPFAPNATGNISTEDVAWMLSRSGFKVNVNLERLFEATEWLTAKLDRPSESLVFRAGLFPG